MLKLSFVPFKREVRGLMAFRGGVRKIALEHLITEAKQFCFGVRVTRRIGKRVCADNVGDREGII